MKRIDLVHAQGRWIARSGNQVLAQADTKEEAIKETRVRLADRRGQRAHPPQGRADPGGAHLSPLGGPAQQQGLSSQLDGRTFWLSRKTFSGS
jgi:hypothetical protein